MKLDVQGQGGGRSLDVDGQGRGGGRRGGGESRKLDNFHGCPMYIIPNMRSEKHVGKTGKRGFK